MKKLRIIFLCICTAYCTAQSPVIDSLEKVLKYTKSDTERINTLNELADAYKYSKQDTAVLLIDQALSLAGKINFKKGKIKSQRIKGIVYWAQGDFPKALECYFSSLNLSEEINDKSGIAKALGNIGTIYNAQADYPKALDYFFKALQMNEDLLKQAVKNGNTKEITSYKNGVATWLGNIGIVYYYQSDYSNALIYYHKALKINEELFEEARRDGNPDEIGKSVNALAIWYGNIGGVYKDKGDFSNALAYYFKALKLAEELENKNAVATWFGNIGIVYADQANAASDAVTSVSLREKALSYYFKALKITEETGDKGGAARHLGNIGIIYADQGDYNKALNTYSKALKTNESLGNKNAIASLFGNIGVVYAKQEDYQNALDNYFKALKMSEELGDKDGIALNLGNIGSLYVFTKDYKKAEECLKKSLTLLEAMGSLDRIKDFEKTYSTLDSTRGNYKGAFEHYKKYIAARDSIASEENIKKQTQHEMQYEFDKKEAIARAEQEKKDVLAKEELEKQRMQRNGFIGGFALMLGLAGVSYRSYRNKQKTNRIISRQKDEVEKQKEIAEYQKHLVEEKNQEILDSISYAKRLQEAILPPLKLVKRSLPESFVLYKPKDIVAGDFYWLEENHGRVLFAAADCTGHGVPGAMVSVVCSNALNRTVKEFGITEPGKILDKTRELVIETFEKSESEVKDGMDISLCSLKFDLQRPMSADPLSHSTLTLFWSGANNPLWIIRRVIAKEERLKQSDETSLVSASENEFELIEIKADKQPIGKYAEHKDFTTHKLDLQQGDTLYIFTDGYADQFGGERARVPGETFGQGKKLKAANFKKLLLSVQNETMEKQKELIDEAFEDWKGSLEQVDDVCVIGVRI